MGRITADKLWDLTGNYHAAFFVLMVRLVLMLVMECLMVVLMMELLLVGVDVEM